MRDSSAIRTKSFRIPSRIRSSTISVPLRPPASPHATTGSPSRFSARATLMPLPPARDSPRWHRCRWPSWKFATLRVLSIAALGVTVTITTREGSGRSQPEGVEQVPTANETRSTRPGAATSRAATSGDVADHGAARPAPPPCPIAVALLAAAASRPRAGTGAAPARPARIVRRRVFATRASTEPPYGSDSRPPTVPARTATTLCSCENPQSSSRPISRSRVAWSAAPSPTTKIRRPPRCAVAARHQPASLVWPVLTPSAPA